MGCGASKAETNVAIDAAERNPEQQQANLKAQQTAASPAEKIQKSAPADDIKPSEEKKQPSKPNLLQNEDIKKSQAKGLNKNSSVEVVEVKEKKPMERPAEAPAPKEAFLSEAPKEPKLIMDSPAPAPAPAAVEAVPAEAKAEQSEEPASESVQEKPAEESPYKSKANLASSKQHLNEPASKPLGKSKDQLAGSKQLLANDAVPQKAIFSSKNNLAVSEPVAPAAAPADVAVDAPHEHEEHAVAEEVAPVGHPNVPEAQEEHKAEEPAVPAVAEAAPQEAAPQEAAPQEAASQEAAPQVESAPQEHPAAAEEAPAAEQPAQE